MLHTPLFYLECNTPPSEVCPASHGDIVLRKSTITRQQMMTGVLDGKAFAQQPVVLAQLPTGPRLPGLQTLTDQIEPAGHLGLRHTDMGQSPGGCGQQLLQHLCQWLL